MDPRTGEYNWSFLTDETLLLRGYGRRQGIVFRRGDPRFEGRTVEEIIVTATADPTCVMVNRNQGSGTRILIDRLLRGARPSGYVVQASNHNAIAAAVAQRRADWGLAIESVARANDLGFLPYQDERYDFVVPIARKERSAVKSFVELLAEESTRRRLIELGFNLADSGSVTRSQKDLALAQGD
jgi:putative molybdopterin biosynthesis protein